MGGKNKQIEQIHKQTDHASEMCKPLEQFMSPFISVLLFQRYKQDCLYVCVCVCRDWYAPGLSRHLQRSVETVQSWQRKGARVWSEGAG